MSSLQNTPPENWKNRTLFHGDNLKFLRAMNSESVDLIATDPPFNKGRDFQATPDKLGKGGGKFSDRWRWNEDVEKEWLDQIEDDNPDIWEVIDATNQVHIKKIKKNILKGRNVVGSDMGAFLCFMAVRLLEMHRVLKPTGSIYLHCDYSASHYLKLILDAIFGKKNFKNDIIWQRASGRAKGSQHPSKRFGNDVDHILYYSKNVESAIHNGFYIPLTDKELTDKFPCEDQSGRRYNTDVPIFREPSLGERPNLCYTYNGVTNPHPSGWRVKKKRLKQMDRNGEIIWREGKRPLRKSFESDYKGKPVGNLWTDIPNVTIGNEYHGYPTQKPLELYERMIISSSKEGAIVLDPFAGCATTCVAAERLGRQWVGIDIWEKAHKIVYQRMVDEVKFNSFTKPIYETKEPLRTDEKEVGSPYLKPNKVLKNDPLKDIFRSNNERKDYLIKTDGFVCQGCGFVPLLGQINDNETRIRIGKRQLELDHDEPRSTGGSNFIYNRILLCKSCNGIKSNTLNLIGLRKEVKKRGLMIDVNQIHHESFLKTRKYDLKHDAELLYHTTGNI